MQFQVLQDVATIKLIILKAAVIQLHSGRLMNKTQYSTYASNFLKKNQEEYSGIKSTKNSLSLAYRNNLSEALAQTITLLNSKRQI